MKRLVALCVLLLAGCTQAPADQGEEEAGLAPLVPALPLGVPLSEQKWVASQCMVQSAVMMMDRLLVANALPEGYEPHGALTANVVLFISRCPTITTGNSTLVHDVDLAFLQVPIESVGNQTEAAETYLLEAIVSHAALATTLAAAGYPVTLGNITSEPAGAGHQTVVETYSSRYVVSAPAIVGENDGTALAREYLHRAGDVEDNLIIHQSYREDAAYRIPQAITVRVTGGALGELLPAEIWPGQWVLSMATSVLDFEVGDSPAASELR